MYIFAQNRVPQLAERGDVRDPDLAAECSCDQIAFTRMDHEVVYWDVWHVAFQRRPPLAAVNRDINSYVIAHEQEVGILVVLDDHIDRSRRQVA